MKTEYKLRFFGDDSGESLKNFIKESAAKATSKTFDKFIPSENKSVVAEDVVKIAAELLYTTPTSKPVVTEEKPVIEIEEPKKQKTILESKFETLQKSLSEDLREYKQKIIEEVSKTTSKPNPYYTLGDSGSGEVRLLNMDDVETKKMSRDTRASILANNETLTYDTRDKKFHFRYALNQDVLKESNVVFNNISATGNINVSGQVFVTSGVTGNIDLTVSGNTSIGKNLLVSGNTILQGNLLVTGYTTTLNVRNLSVTDALIYLNDSSPVTNVDIGVTGNYNDGSYKHAGIFRDSNDGVWKLFDGYTPELNVATKILTSDSSYVDAALKVGNFTANGSATVATTLSVTGNTTAANFNTVGVANVGNSIITALTANKPVFTDANKKLTSSGTVPTDQGGTGLTSFTANGVVYASSSSALATGSALTFDGTTLGVSSGSSTPALKLYGAGTTQGQIQFGSAAGYVIQGGPDYTGLVYNVGSASYQHIFQINSSEQMRLTSTGLGIGTTSPNQKLELRVDTTTAGNEPNILLNNRGLNTTSTTPYSIGGVYGAAYRDIRSPGYVAGMEFYRTSIASGLNSAGDIRFYTGGTDAWTLAELRASFERMRLDSSGNLGIGTSSPVSKLSVNATDGITMQRSTDNAFGGVLDYLKSRGSSASPTGVQNGDGLFLLRVAPYNGSSFTYLNSMYLEVDGTYTSGQNPPTRLIFATNPANGSSAERMRLNSSGNLGLGVTPSAWSASWKAVELAGGSISSDTGGSTLFCYQNTYFNGTNYIYKLTAAASFYKQYSGEHQWLTAPSGTAGNTATFTQAMTLDASGNLGIGTTSPGYRLDVVGSGARLSYNTTSGATLFLNNTSGTSFKSQITFSSSGTGKFSFGLDPSAAGTNNLFWYDEVAGLTRMTLDASGSLGIGTSSPTTTFNKSLHVYQATTGNAGLRVSAGSATGFDFIQDQTGASFICNRDNSYIAFSTNNTERMRLDSSGNLLVGTTSNASGRRFLVASSLPSGGYPFEFQNTASSSPFGLVISYSGAAPNNTSSSFLYLADNSVLRLEVRSNGGIANFQANDANLSDRREKTNFAPAKSYLDVICAIPVQTFNYIDQSEDDPGLTLGVVAQDVQAVAPELVSESNWGTADDPKIRLSIYQTDLQYALMKCIQEQQTLIQSLTDRIAQLETK